MISQALNSQKPIIIFVLLLIDLSLVARAMRIYPTYAPAAAAWSQQQRQKQDTDDDHARQQRPIAMAAAVAATHGQSVRTAVNTQKGHWKAIGGKRDQSLDPPHIDATPQSSVDCRRSSPSSSSHIPDCSKSPAPEEAEGSEIDPRYGVEKRLVPTGPNPLHN